MTASHAYSKAHNHLEREPMHNLLVLDDGTDKSRWLDARIPTITATEAAAIVGSHPYAKMIDVWNEKTDPNYDREANRNKWLDERADLGVEREPEIITWASADSRTGGSAAPFTPNRALVTRPELVEEFPEYPPASTPDGYKVVRKAGKPLVLVEAKATQQRWDQTGLPQHIYDQAQWQLYTTGAVTVWVAAEFYEWQGKGANRGPVLVGKWLHPVQADAKRLEFIQGEVAKFRYYLANDIAPESDLDLRDVAEPDPFESDPADVEWWQEATLADRLLTELAEIEDRMREDAKRATAIKAELGPIVKAYDGRRVHLIGTRFIAKLVRFNKAVQDTKSLPAETLREITSWTEQERVSYEPNPEYTPKEES